VKKVINGVFNYLSRIHNARIRQPFIIIVGNTVLVTIFDIMIRMHRIVSKCVVELVTYEPIFFLGCTVALMLMRVKQLLVLLFFYSL